jgi:RNA polymerase sigma factor (sigma-70 family)
MATPPHRSEDPAFEPGFEAALERVRAYLRLRLSPELARGTEPDELLHETWLEARRSFPTFEPRGPGSFERWLCRIAENRVRDLARRERAPARRPPEEGFSRLLERIGASATGPASAAGRAERDARLERAMAGLDPEERLALLLRHFQGATLGEIAAELGRSETATRRLLGRALGRLRHELPSEAAG